MKIIKPEVKHGIVHRYPDNVMQNYNGWPTVAKDENGVLYAVASTMRLTHVDPCGVNGMWISRDDGEHWSPTIILNNSNFDDRDTGITYMGNGKMGISWFTSVAPDNWLGMQDFDWFKGRAADYCMGFSNMLKYVSDEEREKWNASFVMFSDDYGITWGDPIEVPVSAPHGFTQCRDGSLIYLGTSKEAKNPGRPEDGTGVELYTSHDGGHTWEYTGSVLRGNSIPDAFFCEPHVVELPSGRFMGTMRVHATGCLEGTVYVTYSDDKGKTWSQPERIDETVDGMPPHILVHSSGAVIVSYGCRVEGKRAEKAVVSYDEGKTWTENYVLDDRIDSCNQKDMGYPATVELSDGSLLTLYYQGLDKDWYTSILYTKWKLEK